MCWVVGRDSVDCYGAGESEVRMLTAAPVSFRMSACPMVQACYWRRSLPGTFGRRRLDLLYTTSLVHFSWPAPCEGASGCAPSCVCWCCRTRALGRVPSTGWQRPTSASTSVRAIARGRRRAVTQRTRYTSPVLPILACPGISPPPLSPMMVSCSQAQACSKLKGLIEGVDGDIHKYGTHRPHKRRDGSNPQNRLTKLRVAMLCVWRCLLRLDKECTKMTRTAQWPGSRQPHVYSLGKRTSTRCRWVDASVGWRHPRHSESALCTMTTPRHDNTRCRLMSLFSLI